MLEEGVGFVGAWRGVKGLCVGGGWCLCSGGVTCLCLCLCLCLYLYYIYMYARVCLNLCFCLCLYACCVARSRVCEYVLHARVLFSACACAGINTHLFPPNIYICACTCSAHCASRVTHVYIRHRYSLWFLENTVNLLCAVSPKYNVDWTSKENKKC